MDRKLLRARTEARLKAKNPPTIVYEKIDMDKYREEERKKKEALGKESGFLPDQL